MSDSYQDGMDARMDATDLALRLAAPGRNRRCRECGGPVKGALTFHGTHLSKDDCIAHLKANMTDLLARLKEKP